MKQANTEARAALCVLALIIVVWLVCGFGLSGIDVRIWGMPIWVLCGCTVPIIVASVAAAFLARRVIKDVNFDDIEPVSNASQATLDDVSALSKNE